MDKLRSMEVFMAVVDHGSLSTAAAALSLSPSMVSTHLSNLERDLGVRLLNRTTRRINLTDEGTIFYAHCQHLHEEIANVESVLAGSHMRPRGRLRVDIPSILGQYLVVPLLHEFRSRYPDIQLDFSDSEQISDTVESQHDVIVRLGPLGDSSMIARPLGYTPLLTVASPRYLETHPLPQVPEELREHDCISYRDTRTGRMHPWIFERHGQRKTLQLSSCLSITQGCIQIEAALNGLGIMQGMGFYLDEHLRNGALRQILPDWTILAPDIEMLYPRGRRESRKVHAFVDFMLEHYPSGTEIKAPSRAYFG
ncbi:LysR substrate-binding domain-containing protein [Pseudomonas sp. B392_1p]|uniref:LysR substrate-binding domain-containing protein n=1 Tax=Pseudomonas sp. B392_1p TaxID=3457507 RepID=UPI003FD324B0